MDNQNANRAVVAADHLVGNLWFTLDALPLIAAHLDPDTMRMIVPGPAAMAYSEMCRLMRSPSEQLSAGALEAGLRAQGFNFAWLSDLQQRIGAESVDVLHQYAAEVNNAAALRKIQMQCTEAARAAQADDARAEVVAAELVTKLATSAQAATNVEHISQVAGRVRQRLQDVRAGNDKQGLRTGFHALDRLFQMEHGDLIILGGRPSQGKCLGAGTKVLMHDGTLRAVENVQVGDQLMGPDSQPRSVMALGHGREMMYWIHQSFGISYRVNEGHILSLKRSKNEKQQKHGTVKNITVKDALGNLKYIKSRFKGYKVAVEFPEQAVPIEPYFIGLWLGDGTSSKCDITTIDGEIVSYLGDFASRLGGKLRQVNQYGTPMYGITWGDAGRGRSWTLQGQLRTLGVLNNKHIPQQYLVNSTENRLQLLAGLLDSDGYYAGNYFNGRGAGNYFEATFKEKELAEQVKFLCDSLGFRTSINAKHATIKSIGFDSIVYRVRLAGDLDRIPTKIARKQAKPWTDFRDWTMSGIDIVPDKVDDYYGFELDGDGLFLLEDMTVTHNTSLWQQIFLNVAERIAETGDDGQVVMFSADDTSEKIMTAMACAKVLVDQKRLMNRTATAQEWDLVEQGIAHIESLPIYIDETSGPTIDTMYYRCAMLSAQKPVRLAGMDYMELIRHDKIRDDLQKVEASATGAKGIGRTLGFPFLMLSQLRKDVDNRADKWPTASDVRYAGEAEADKMLLIMRPEHYIARGESVDCDDKDREGVALVNVAKNKRGDVGLVRLAFKKEYARFTDLAQEV